ncbi:MAG: hypothetical protein KDD53_12105 [Bdellovibrionales bacterium]|nr:hypothetical protein [Bdellovibrionales bacterium]
MSVNSSLTQPQVILLHGLLRSKYSMAYLGSALSRAGFKVFNFGYRSRKYSIAHHAEVLCEFASHRVERSVPLHFVTHSLGSLVVRTFAHNYSSEFSLGRAVMLGPPNQGSQFARKVGFFSGIRSFMGPSFEEICNLQIPIGSDCLEIGIIAGGVSHEKGISPFIDGDDDGVVSVQETKLPGAKDTIILKSMHSVMMYSSTVIEQTIYFLQNGIFRRK